MIFISVQAVKIIRRFLDLGAVVNLEAHADEDVLELVNDDVHGVLVPAVDALAGQRDVQRLGCEPGLQRGLLERHAAAVYRLFKLRPDAVGELTHGRALLRGELSHLLQDCRELALFPEIPDAQRVQLGHVGRRGDGLE